MIEASLVAPALAPLLYHGSLPPLGRALADDGFDVLVVCNQEPYLPPRLFQPPGPHPANQAPVKVLHCPLPDEGGLNARDLRLACATADEVAGLHRKRAARRDANVRYAKVRARDAWVLAARASGSRRAPAIAEARALHDAVAAALAAPADRQPPGWPAPQRPLTAPLADADRVAMVRRGRQPVTVDEHLVHGWAALRAAEQRRVLVACLQGAGLVCALVLHILSGRAGTYCVQLVRRAREGALTNPRMLELLFALPARPAQPAGARR